MAWDIGKASASASVICLTIECMFRFKPVHESRACYSYSENPAKVFPRAYIPLNMRIKHEKRDITFLLKCKDITFSLSLKMNLCCRPTEYANEQYICSQFFGLKLHSMPRADTIFELHEEFSGWEVSHSETCAFTIQ